MITKAPRENKLDEFTIVVQASRLHSLYRLGGTPAFPVPAGGTPAPQLAKLFLRGH